MREDEWIEDVTESERSAYVKVRMMDEQLAVLGCLRELELDVSEEVAWQAVREWSAWLFRQSTDRAALKGIVRSAVAAASRPGIRVKGVLQDWDLYDNRVDMWRAEFTVSAAECAGLDRDDLEALFDAELYYTDAPGESRGEELLYDFALRAYERGHLALGTTWSWEDPCRLKVEPGSVKALLEERDAQDRARAEGKAPVLWRGGDAAKVRVTDFKANGVESGNRIVTGLDATRAIRRFLMEDWCLPVFDDRGVYGFVFDDGTRTVYEEAGA